MAIWKPYTAGQRLLWTPHVAGEEVEVVEVVRVRRDGGAILSNGWTVDQEGLALGTLRRPGGWVEDCVAAV